MRTRCPGKMLFLFCLIMQDFYDSISHGTEFGSGGPVLCILAFSSEDGLPDRKVIGFVTAQVQALDGIEEGGLPRPRDGGAWGSALYILTLGVDEQFRRQGIAQALVLKAIAFGESQPGCMAVFLHVITYNTPAIEFYRRMGFNVQREIGDFYYIEGKRYSCFLCISYINGAEDPSMHSWLSSIVRSLGGLWKFLVNTLVGEQAKDPGNPTGSRRASYSERSQQQQQQDEAEQRIEIENKAIIATTENPANNFPSNTLPSNTMLTDVHLDSNESWYKYHSTTSSSDLKDNSCLGSNDEVARSAMMECV
uniref:N-alpha-acetyltransferase 60 n=1 Tax=Heterosigma akashiwo TaxID=2829 RepID=A0A7S3XKF5_HETAK